MALEINKRRGIFRTKQIWFADYPYNIKGFDRVIFRDCKNKIDMSGFNSEKIVTLVIDLTQDLDKIWKNMSSGNCRKAIRRAERAGVKVSINQNYNEFYNLYKSVVTMKKLPEAIKLKDVKKYAVLFAAESNGEVISGHAYLEDKDHMRSWVIGSERFGVNKEYTTLVANASKLIIWEAIKYAKSKNIKEFDFGGYYTGGKRDEQKEKINIFKQSFGGKLVTHYIYRKDYSKIYNFITKIYHRSKNIIK